MEFAAQMVITDPHHRYRLQAIDLCKRWIDFAVALDCPRVLVNQGNLAREETGPLAVEALRTIRRYADSKGVMVAMENRSADWEYVAEVVTAAGIYTTPDLGNFPDQESQLAGIRLLFPMNSGNAQVKMRPERYDLPTALVLATQLGYSGIFSIEAGSNVDPDPYLAVQKILVVLLEHV